MKKLLMTLVPCLLLFANGCAPAPPSDPVGVVKAEVQAVNKGQVDLAVSYFSDDAQVISAIGQPQGKAKIKAYLTNLVAMKEHDEVVDLAVDGANVTGNLKISDTALAAPTNVMLKAVVQNGKITMLETGSKAQ